MNITLKQGIIDFHTLLKEFYINSENISQLDKIQKAYEYKNIKQGTFNQI